MRLKTRSALLKRVPRDGDSAYGVKAAVASVGRVKDASAAHSSQELQLHDEAVSPGGSPSTDMPSVLCAFMAQSSGMADMWAEAGPVLAELCVIKTCCTAMSTAIASPTQARIGSKAIMRATNKRRMAQGYDKIAESIVPRANDALLKRRDAG